MQHSKQPTGRFLTADKVAGATFVTGICLLAVTADRTSPPTASTVLDPINTAGTPDGVLWLAFCLFAITIGLLVSTMHENR